MSNEFAWHSEELPDYWSYGVTYDGRVFFINDARHFTNWCHPITGHPVQSGYYEDPGLPRGWQFDLDSSGNPYYINHLNQVTTKSAPSLHIVNPPDRTYSSVGESTQKMKIELNPSISNSSPAAVQLPGIPVEMEGWLLRQEGLFKQWKRRWFNISGNRLFCYKDMNEKHLLTSYPLEGSSFVPCYGDPGILKMSAFKIMHKKKRLVYLATESVDKLHDWLRALSAGGESEDADYEVFHASRRTGGDPFPQHLAQRSHSMSGVRDRRTHEVEPEENPHRRSQSYHNLNRSRDASTRDPNDPGRQRSSGDEVTHLDRALVEQRSRTPIYSPGVVTFRSADNLAEGSPHWSGDRGAPKAKPRMANHRSDYFQFGNGNPPLSTDSPLLRQNLDIKRGINRLSSSSYMSENRSSQPPIDGYRQLQDQSASHLRPEGSRVNSMASSPSLSQRPNSAHLPHLDESVKTWKSFERPQEGSSGANFGSSSNFDRNNSMQNRSSVMTSNPDQLYSSVLRPKGLIPRRQPGDVTSPDYQRKSQQLNSQSSLSLQGLDSRNPSTRSLQQPHSDNFSSVSKYNSRPSLANNEGQRSGTSMANLYTPGYGPDATDLGRSADSLNTLKTNGSSKSSSKNTYYLSSNANTTLANNNNNGVNQDAPRNDSNLVNGEGSSNFQNSSVYSVHASPPSIVRNSNLERRRNVPRNFSAIKEDPDMPDDQVLSSRNLEDLQKKLASHTRLRLSISIQDLMGKSYEEVVLFLIQLKRSQSELQQMCSKIKRKLNSPPSSAGKSMDRRSLERQIETVEKQMEVTQPLINLLDNMLTMGSLFSGNGLMYASEYKKNQLRADEMVPTKAMLEFNRCRQEELVGKTRPRSRSEVDTDKDHDPRMSMNLELEEELKELHRLDVLLQERSCAVTSLQKDKEMIERAIIEVKAKLSNSPMDPMVEEHLMNQRLMLERDLSATIVQLADASKQLEDATVEMVKSEENVIHLQNQLHSSKRNDVQNNAGLQHSGNSSYRLRQMEQQVEEIGNVLRGTSDRMNSISDNITSIKRSRSSHSLTRGGDRSSPDHGTRPNPGYLETDLDHKTTKDTSVVENQFLGRTSRKDQFQSSPNHLHVDRSPASGSRSSSVPRKNISNNINNNLYQYENPYSSRNYSGPESVDSRSSSHPVGSVASSHNRDPRYMGQRHDGPSRQSTGVHSTNARISPGSYRTPYSPNSARNSSSSGTKLALSPGNKNYGQNLSPSNWTSTDDVMFNETTIDNAVFRPPPRVQIPQRYFQDPEETLESIDPVDIYHKQQKAEQVKKLLAIQSLQDFTVEELGRADGNINDRIRSELKEREDLLELKKNLAKQVTERSRNFINS